MGFRVAEDDIKSAHAVGHRIAACPNCQRRADVIVEAQIPCDVTIDPRGHIKRVNTEPYFPMVYLDDIKVKCAACGASRELDDEMVEFIGKAIDVMTPDGEN